MKCKRKIIQFVVTFTRMGKSLDRALAAWSITFIRYKL